MLPPKMGKDFLLLREPQLKSMLKSGLNKLVSTLTMSNTSSPYTKLKQSTLTTPTILRSRHNKNTRTKITIWTITTRPIRSMKVIKLRRTPTFKTKEIKRTRTMSIRTQATMLKAKTRIKLRTKIRINKRMERVLKTLPGGMLMLTQLLT